MKSFLDCEATVIAHEPGKGRHEGRLGALTVELSNGIRCQVGTGFTDAQRNHAPAIGTVITLKYQELTDDGVPRLPVFAGMRTDSSLTASSPTQEDTLAPTSVSATTTLKRRFEFADGSSYKFWEISIQGTDVSVAYGRIGTASQTSIKQFATAADAAKNTEKLIREKTGKGYAEAT